MIPGPLVTRGPRCTVARPLHRHIPRNVFPAIAVVPPAVPEAGTKCCFRGEVPAQHMSRRAAVGSPHNFRTVRGGTIIRASQLCEKVVRPEGIEPPTFGFVVRRSIQLS